MHFDAHHTVRSNNYAEEGGCKNLYFGVNFLLKAASKWDYNVMNDEISLELNLFGECNTIRYSYET